MRPVKVFTDTTADLSAELCEKYGITEIPLYLTLGGVTMKDMVEITPSDVIEAYEKSGELPKSSAITIYDFESAFTPWVGKGYDVIYVSISSELSSCYQNACAAADGNDSIYIIDSRNISAGIGLLAIEASEMAAEGYSAERITDILNERKERIDVSFVVGNIEFLHKGGRCSGVAAFGANLLGIKPVVEVVDGRLRVGRKYRGKFDKCVENYIADRLLDSEGIELGRMMYASNGCDPKMRKAAAKIIKKSAPFKNAVETEIGTTVTGHIGPEVFGLLVVRKKEETE